MLELLHFFDKILGYFLTNEEIYTKDEYCNSYNIHVIYMYIIYK